MKKNFKEIPDKDMVVLCGEGTCCPTIDFSNPAETVFRDDFGGRVRMTPQQYQGLTDFIISKQKKQK